jgi:hypothetical protein
MSRRVASDTVATAEAAAIDRRSIGRITARLRRVNSCGMRRSARSCTKTMAGHGEAIGMM